MNGGKIVDTNLICKLPVQTSRDFEPCWAIWPHVIHKTSRALIPRDIIQFTEHSIFSGPT